MSRSPFWSDERVMARYRDFIECNGAEYANVAWQSVIREMRDEYETALDGARIAGLDAAVADADGDTIDEWKERCWQAEQCIADRDGLAADIGELREENANRRGRIVELEEKLTAAAKIIQEREDMCEGANEAIAMYKKRIADLEAQKNVAVDSMAQYRGIFPYDPDGPSSEERVRASRDGDEQDMMSRRIDKLADRVAQLEREQREGQGEL